LSKASCWRSENEGIFFDPSSLLENCNSNRSQTTATIIFANNGTFDVMVTVTFSSGFPILVPVVRIPSTFQSGAVCCYLIACALGVVTMKLIPINPNAIVFDDDRSPDETIVESIAEEGLYDDPKGPSEVRDMIAVRRQPNNTYLAVKRADELRAVIALLDRDADCYDPASGQTVKARELYETIRVTVLD
jgi:hypothetical protein